MKTKVIMNPAARKGRSGENWGNVQALLNQHLDDYNVSFTEQAGHAKSLARQALDDGYERFIAVGGDGTANEVLNGLCENGTLMNPNTVMSVIPAGTANEICRSLGLLEDPTLAYQVLSNGKPISVDLQMISCENFNGERVKHHGALLTSVGSAAEISHKTSRSKYIKRLGAELSYFIVTLLVTLTYKPKEFVIQIDDGPEETLTLTTGLICNMKYGGGGMKLAPNAIYDDGEFDFVLFDNFTRTDLLTKSPSWLFEGRHIDHPKIDVRRGRKVRISSEMDSFVDADGETIGRIPLELEMKPNALTFLAMPE
jgi:YegS/Rv2252/BmrU family lipid kinase